MFKLNSLLFIDNKFYTLAFQLVFNPTLLQLNSMSHLIA